MARIIVRNTAVSGSIPTTLVQGELAINVTDGKLYYGSSSANIVKEFTGSGGGGGGSTVSASYATTASYAVTASYAFTSSYANNFYVSGAITSVDYIDFDTSASVTQPVVGRLSWNNTDGTLDLGLKGGNVTLQIGQEEVVRIVNKTGGNLLEADYSAVRVRLVSEGGAQGQRLAVVLAQGDSDTDSATTIGLVTEDIAVNQEGFITISGLVRGINTTGTLQGETWVDGDILYLSPTTPGYLTNVKPSAPQHMIIMGYVVYAHNNQGKIFVKVDNGYEIDELHNVKIDTGSLTSGQLLVRSGSVWTNSNQLTGSYGLTGSLNATSFTGSLFGTSSWATNAGNSSTIDINVFGSNVESYLLMSNVAGTTGVAIGGDADLRYNASTNNLTVGSVSATSLTGSLLGTASFASTASFLNSTTNAFIQNGNSFGATAVLGTNDNQSLALETSGSTRMFISSSGNVGIGTLTPAFTLDVSSSARVQGISYIGPSQLRPFGSSIAVDPTGTNLAIIPSNVSNTLVDSTGAIFLRSNTVAITSNLYTLCSIQTVFSPTSGTGINNNLTIHPIINQTGGANGITRGLYVNPTLTAAADFRAVENTVGNNLLNSTSGNTYIGLSTNTGTARLQVRGSGATSSTISLRVENTNASASLLINDVGNVLIGTETNAGYKLDVSGSARSSGGLLVGGTSGVGGIFVQAGSTINRETIAIRGSLLTTDIGTDIVISNGQGNAANLSGTRTIAEVSRGFVPTSGTGVFNSFVINPTINQTGGANGITRGLYVNPTLTSAADFRAIETARGNILFQSSSTPLLFVSESGNVGIGTSTPAYTLDVNGIIQANGTRRILVDSTNGLVSIKGSAGGWANYFGFLGSSNGVRGGFGALGAADTLTYYYIGASHTAPTMVLTSGSNLVGINTTTPTATLDVSGSARITNTLVVTGSLIAIEATGGTERLNTSNGTLSRAGVTSVHWRNRTLNNSSGITTLDWDQYQINDSFSSSSIDWDQRILNDANTLSSVEYNDRVLRNSANAVILDWEGGVLTGTASTSSYVNTLNQNVIITGSLTVGSSSLGPNENTITLGPRDTTNEGGQIGFNAPGGTYSSASMIDLYQDRLRILRGTNAGSDAEVAWWSMHNKQMALPAYNSATAFPGTGSAMLTTDTSGNIITQVYKDVAEQTYTGAIAWTGTAAPSGSTNHTYRWSQVGKTVNLNIVLTYTGPGNAVSTVTTALPADCPTPYVPSGQSGAGALISVVSAHLTNTTTIGANIARGGLRINLTNNGYELTATATAAGYKVLVTSVQYFAV